MKRLPRPPRPARLPAARPAAQADRARRMRLVATSMLAAMAIVFVIALRFEHLHPAVGYVVAFAEAAMVGGLADWFAVTALFRHPLRLPIPHTAIIPRRKDQLGAALGTFVEQNFLSEDVVVEKLRSVSVARRAAAWAVQPDNAATVARHAGAALHGALDVLRDEDVQDVVENAVIARVRDTRLAPIAGRALDVMTANGRHQELLDAALRSLGRFVDEHRDTFR